MAAHINPRPLFLSLSFLLFLHLARPDDLAPSPSSGPESSLGSVPVPSPSVGSGPSPLPSTTAHSPSHSPDPDADAGADIDEPVVSNGPGPSPSNAPSPNADADVDGPTSSDGPTQFDFSVAPITASEVSPKVKDICDSTDHPELCLATVVPCLHGGDYDVPTVVEVSIRAGLALARIGLSLSKNAPGSPHEMGSVLRDCRDSYDDAVYNFESAIDAFPRRDTGTMKSMLSAVITNVGDCNDGLAPFRDESPFTSVAEKLTNMTSNCLAIVSLLD
ncbi:Plant invertase/pectin methylesterase inhibitor superfamily protein [Striga hermonthica]|uniref:Plant invertase/pectin methylesterase inhibitor superfamily protein n=1 Tax=Striga hermonthica TaxID=68872 RepID=A0A9N7N914_STRHE|nr:Plant invertase/pectin methylesterase inhibitor superfamily protein [Striga hermonthica]